MNNSSAPHGEVVIDRVNDEISRDTLDHPRAIDSGATAQLGRPDLQCVRPGCGSPACSRHEGQIPLGDKCR